MPHPTMLNARPTVPPVSRPTARRLAPPKPLCETKLVLLPFRNGEALLHHPDLAELFRDGWSVRSATPRLVEGQGTRLLVVLSRPNGA